MKKILLIATGGTISSKDTNYGLAPFLKSQELISHLPKKDYNCTLNTIDLMNIDSSNIEPKHWVEIASKIADEYEHYDGFVITHGTDTLTYTSAALSYLVQNSKKPIILTGSQKPINAPCSDGVTNLSASIIFACQNVGGVFIVFNSKVILGTKAKKVHSKSDDAFASLNMPYVAVLKGDKIIWNNDVVKRLFDNKMQVEFYLNINPKVALLKLSPGLNPELLQHLAKLYDAIVIESYGLGAIPFNKNNNFLEALEKITINGCIVVIVSQTLEQGTYMYTYEVGRRALYINNVAEGGLLSVECSITKLMWALGVTDDNEKVLKLVNTSVALDR